ncbi:MAG: hypothetical protein AAFX81_15960 [Pseudomonadota bacterium]
MADVDLTGLRAPNAMAMMSERRPELARGWAEMAAPYGRPDRLLWRFRVTWSMLHPADVRAVEGALVAMRDVGATGLLPVWCHAGPRGTQPWTVPLALYATQGAMAATVTGLVGDGALVAGDLVSANGRLYALTAANVGDQVAVVPPLRGTFAGEPLAFGPGHGGPRGVAGRVVCRVQLPLGAPLVPRARRGPRRGEPRWSIDAEFVEAALA